MNELSDEVILEALVRVFGYARQAKEESETNDSEFAQGKRLAYYEVLDTIKNCLTVNDVDLKKYGLDISLEELV